MSFKQPKIRQTNPGILTKLSKHARRKAHVNVGVISGEGHEESDLTVAAVGFFNEFGTVDIPERSFLRSIVKEERPKIRAKIRETGRSIINFKSDIDTELGKLGLYVAGKVQKKITDIRVPKNKASTIARKRSSNPLIDSGQLRQSITHEVVSGSAE